MANIDEELQGRTEEEPEEKPEETEFDEEEAEEEQRRQEALENYNQQQRRQKQSTQQKIQSGVETVQTVKKWYKRYRKAIVVWGFLGTSTSLGILLVLFIVGAFVGGCNGSLAFRVASLGSCEAFIVSTGGRSGGAGGGTTFPPPSPGTGTYSDAEARTVLSNAGIAINAVQPQTSLQGIQTVTINEIINFNAACDASLGSCDVVVTGGTETGGGHEGGPCSHLSGHKVDIRASSTVNNYIRNPANFTQLGNRSDGALQYQNNKTKIVYALETDHWDIGGVGCT